MTQDEIIEMAESCGWDKGNTWDDCMRCSPFNIEDFAKLVEQHVRNTMNDEAKAHLEELRKNFDVESAELRLHQWSKEKQA